MADAARLIPIPWTQADVIAMQPSVDASPWGPLEGPHDVLAGSALFSYDDGGQHALVAVRLDGAQHGRILRVVGLVSTGERLGSAGLSNALDDLAATLGADQLSMTTQRPHIIKGCTANGWGIKGMVLTKEFHRVQQ